MFHVLHYNKGERKREGAKEGESRAQGMGKFILRLVRLYSFGPALFTLEQFTFSWFGVRRAYSFTKKERERERERKRESHESRAWASLYCV